jgi:hypothetical protein
MAEVSLEDALRIVAPYLEAVLKRHRAHYDSELLCEEIVYYTPDFNPTIFKGIPTETIVENTRDFFNYKKTTFGEMRQEFFQ